MQNKFLVVDLETSSLNREKCLIFEIGIVLVDLDKNEKHIVLDEFIKPDRIWNIEILAKSKFFEISNATMNDVINGKKLGFYRQRLQKWFLTYPCVSYNVGFDFEVLHSKNFTFRRILDDPMLIIRDMMKIPKKPGKKYIDDDGSPYKFPKFEKAWEYIFSERKYKHLHRAGSDAMAEAEVIIELYNRGLFNI